MARRVLGQKIRKAIRDSTRSGTCVTEELFGASGPSRYTLLHDEGLTVGRVGIDDIQRLAFLEMAKYGVNPEADTVRKKLPLVDTDIATEELAFSSPTHPNLEFARWRQFYTDTDNTFAFGWVVRQYPPK
ncbi:MAG: hypothetical protein HYV40_02115, partial [Candidatus Levybacteria bacterium]|nr:hypothetical protein [Candidatus Levybacteria bacterium]